MPIRDSEPLRKKEFSVLANVCSRSGWSKAGSYRNSYSCTSRAVGADPADVEAELTSASAWLNGANKPGIDSNNLFAARSRPSNPGGHSARNGWTCPTCSAFYMHRAAGRCADCNLELRPGLAHTSLDYYRYLAEKAGGGFRFTARNSPGKTDAIDKPNRQRWFQEVFLPDEKEIR